MTLSKVLPAAAGLLLASVLVSEPAHADAFGRVTTILQNIVSTLAGPLGRALATIGVIIVGLMWTFGQIDLKRAGAVVVGIGIIFGAAEIVGQLSGG